MLSRMGFWVLVKTASFLLTAMVAPVSADTYDIVKEFAGSNFFDDWVFYDHFDNLTNGDAIFVSAAEGKSSKLAFVDDTTKHAIIKVDNTTNVPTSIKRNTVRIKTADRYSVGSVWVADILHVPFGCSVWPAWWSNSPDWPTGGEIDTFEGVNQVTRSQMGLHTNPGCKQTSPVQTSTIINSTDCSSLANSNQGCITIDPSPTSYGAAFAQAGGAVFVTEFAEKGISVWSFPRASVPSVLSSNATRIDTSVLGTPIGNWPSTDCSSSTFFNPQNLILDITLCGDFAGAPSVFSQTCSGVCYDDYVVGNGSNYADAYFEIDHIRVYSKTGTNTVVKAGNSAMQMKLGSATFWVALLGIFWLLR